MGRGIIRQRMIDRWGSHQGVGVEKSRLYSFCTSSRQFVVDLMASVLSLSRGFLRTCEVKKGRMFLHQVRLLYGPFSGLFFLRLFIGMCNVIWRFRLNIFTIPRACIVLFWNEILCFGMHDGSSECRCRTSSLPNHPNGRCGKLQVLLLLYAAVLNDSRHNSHLDCPMQQSCSTVVAKGPGSSKEPFKLLLVKWCVLFLRPDQMTLLQMALCELIGKNRVQSECRQVQAGGWLLPQKWRPLKTSWMCWLVLWKQLCEQNKIKTVPDLTEIPFCCELKHWGGTDLHVAGEMEVHA